MSKYVENYWVEELPNGVIKLIINCTQKEIYYHSFTANWFIIASTQEEYENNDQGCVLKVEEFLPKLEGGIYLPTSHKEDHQLYFFYIPHLKEWRKDRNILLRSNGE